MLGPLYPPEPTEPEPEDPEKPKEPKIVKTAQKLLDSEEDSDFIAYGEK